MSISLYSSGFAIRKPYRRFCKPINATLLSYVKSDRRSYDNQHRITNPAQPKNFGNTDPQGYSTNN